jgi:hypothetical protein
MLAASRSQKWLSEEQDVHPDNENCHRDHVQRARCRPSHGATVPGAK